MNHGSEIKRRMIHAVMYAITVESRFLELPRETKLVRKIEGDTKLRLIYEVLFCNNRESKQKYHGTFVRFLAYI